MTTLKNQITDALKTSMRAKDMATVTVLRSLQAAIKQIEVDELIPDNKSRRHENCR